MYCPIEVKTHPQMELQLPTWLLRDDSELVTFNEAVSGIQNWVLPRVYVYHISCAQAKLVLDNSQYPRNG